MIIAIVGKSGAGKNFVADQFVHHGYVHCDLDVIAHDIMNRKYALLAELFGDDVLYINNTINRNVLANIVFADKRKLKLLEQLLANDIAQEISVVLDRNEDVVLNGATLYKSEFIDSCDEVIWVDASLYDRFSRLMKRDKHRSIFQIAQRIWAQRHITPRLYSITSTIDTTNVSSMNAIITIIVRCGRTK